MTVVLFSSGFSGLLLPFLSPLLRLPGRSLLSPEETEGGGQHEGTAAAGPEGEVGSGVEWAGLTR